MKRLLLFLLIYSVMKTLTNCSDSKNETPLSFEDYPVYSGKDLGLTFSEDEAALRVWAPTAEALNCHVYGSDLGADLEATLNFEKSESGTWLLKISSEWSGKYYTVQAKIDGKWMLEVADPYVKAVGRNGKRGQLINHSLIGDSAWFNYQRPEHKSFRDIVLYEVHIRDFSIDSSSGIANKGKYLGMVERGTKSEGGISTGLDHLVELGITHLHLLPCFDYYSIDETRLDEAQYNWGYDPLNYNVPEGSYATNPEDGAVRISEFRQMVRGLHEAGIQVIMDVVYNHTGPTLEHPFNQLVPGYYYRQDSLGNFSNASGCGNEVASERPMVRKFIIESLEYWAKEYHIEGFRFDLMGIHDIKTMNEIRKAMNAISPGIFLYGEGWTASDSPLASEKLALKANTKQLDRIAAFSDDFRDGVKGSVFEHKQPGFISGSLDLKESVKFGLVGNIAHPQVKMEAVNYSDVAWADSPEKSINYVSCHDNHTLFDRFRLSVPNANIEELKRLQLLSLSAVLLGQGVPFLHSGSEFLRSKQGEENSYKSSDAINRINWDLKEVHQDASNFVKDLIQIRKELEVFRFTASQIEDNVSFIESNKAVIGMHLKSGVENESISDILIFWNTSENYLKETLPQGVFKCLLSSDMSLKDARFSNNIQLPNQSVVLLKRE